MEKVRATGRQVMHVVHATKATLICEC